MKSFAIVLIFLWVVASCEAPQSPEVVYYIDFEEDRHLEAFVPETEVNSDEVTVKEGYLDIDAVKGATVWFREKLYAPIKIEYTAVVVEEGGPNDRVSDLNCFFMAIDPRCPANVFDCADSVRTGRFPTYHDLRTYYVGFGGNNNGTTRMRRYPGYTRERPMLPEHDLKSPLIVPNQPIKVEITVEGNGISYAHDGTVIFEMEDELPYHEGWFAFRTVRNHLRIMDFSVTALD
ncbi:MAG: DUF6250 domain-containing protein [Bacteroidota bacterium]